MDEMFQHDVFGIPPLSPPTQETVHDVTTESQWVDPKTRSWVSGQKQVTVTCGEDGKPTRFDAGSRGHGEVERWEGNVGYGTFRTAEGREFKAKVTLMENAYGGRGIEYAIGNGTTNVAKGRGRL